MAACLGFSPAFPSRPLGLNDKRKLRMRPVIKEVTAPFELARHGSPESPRELERAAAATTTVASVHSFSIKVYLLHRRSRYAVRLHQYTISLVCYSSSS